jgi:hypothetical protein
LYRSRHFGRGRRMGLPAEQNSVDRLESIRL